MAYTINIAWYGTTVYKEGEKTISKKNDKLTTVLPVIADLESKKPEALTKSDYRSLNIIEGGNATFMASIPTLTYSVATSSLDQVKLAALVAEMKAIPAPPVSPSAPKSN